ncbi:MAG: glycosyltransferase family 4 protein [Phycisphaerae bacterium]|nr:glycosyltransferase family 4 protein [Phycisphaerae bacterium]
MVATGRPLTILFVNRWRGTIGPNVWLEQIVSRCLRRGLGVHIASPWRDAVLDGLAASGARVHLVEGIEWVPRSLNPLRYLGHVAAGLRASRELAALARRVEADAICINGLNALLLPRAGALAGRPVAAVLHGTRLAGLGAFNRLFFAIQGRWVDRYLVVVELGRDLLAREGIDPQRIAVLPNGVDTERFRPTPRGPGLVAELGLAEGAPVIGAVTHLTPRKGVHHLVAAMARVAAKVPDVRCVIVGDITAEEDRPYAARISRDIQRLQLGERILLTGRRADVPELMNLFDLLVHPSETEACPFSVLEAQSCARAVVGFRVGGMVEVIQDGQTGVLVAPRDADALAEAVLALLADPARRRSLGDNGRQRIQRHFNLQTNAEKVVTWLEDLCRLGRSPR